MGWWGGGFVWGGGCFRVVGEVVEWVCVMQESPWK